MTSGGDSPGMNGFVRAVIRMSIARGCEAYAIYEGYEGLVQGGDLIKEMEWGDVRGWLSEGGTLIGTARVRDSGVSALKTRRIAHLLFDYGKLTLSS